MKKQVLICCGTGCRANGSMAAVSYTHLISTIQSTADEEPIFISVCRLPYNDWIIMNITQSEQMKKMCIRDSDYSGSQDSRV